MKRSCCIFFYEGHISIAPTIISLVKSLSEQGYCVFIYSTKHDLPTFKIPNDRIVAAYFPKGYNIPAINIIYTVLGMLKLGMLVRVIELLLFISQSALYTLKNYHLILPMNSIVIGVDANGSIASLLNFYFFKRQFAYLSLEIYPPKYFGKLARIIKWLECLAYRKAECILIQDEDRFKSLGEFNNYDHKKVFYLPNSTVSFDDKHDKLTNSNYWRNIFNLSEKEFPYIIIQAGMICDEVFSKELAYAFSFINNKSALIFHEKEKRDVQDTYIKSLIESNSHNLFLSLEPLPFERIDEIFASATIGLAFYRNVNHNFAQIAKASGKLSFYLKHGKPVLVNNLESLSTIVEKYKIGIVIQNPSDHVEIQSAIELILSNYSFYSENAKKCFAEEFDFAKKVQPFLSYITNW
ncbi:glycosyltransferase family 4 protein [Scytonema tolypothrichoides VB-61278]|nr:glycosyltransferase family 4 protein [Scytonema tolypothrichoides VB-61278]